MYLEQNYVTPSSMVALWQKIYSQDLVPLSWEHGKGKSVMGLNQIGWLWTCTESREIIDQGYTKRSGQKIGSLWGSVPPGKMGETETSLWHQWQLWCNQVYQGKVLEAITQVQNISTGIHIHPLCCGCPVVRSMAATLLRWGRSAEDTRMSLLLLTRGMGDVSHGKSHFPENIWHPNGGKLQGNLFLPGMLLLFGNKDLIFQVCQYNIFYKY